MDKPSADTSSKLYSQQSRTVNTSRPKKFSWVKRLMNNNSNVIVSSSPSQNQKYININNNANSNIKNTSIVNNTKNTTNKNSKREQLENVTVNSNYIDIVNWNSQDGGGNNDDNNNNNNNNNNNADDNNTINNINNLDTIRLRRNENIPKKFQFNDLTSVENDEMISFISSNASLKLQESYQKQFYTKKNIDNNNINCANDLNTAASINSLYSATPVSINSNNNASINTGNNKICFNNQLSLPRGFTHNSNNHYNTFVHQHNHILNHDYVYHNLDVASTLSGSIFEDNVSTKPLISNSSEEEEQDDEEEEEDDDDERDDDDVSIRGNISRKLGQNSIHEESEFNNNNNNNNGSNNINNNDTQIILQPEENKLITASGPEEQDYFDDYSFEVRSKYPSSSRSTALTSMSVMTSPVLTTINSSTTMATMATGAASVMTLASSSRHIQR
jgi:hypothetical protein